MKRITFIFLLNVLIFSNVIAQYNLTIKDLKPNGGEEFFPEILFAEKLKIAEKINIVLHLENLLLLPNTYKKSPFEENMPDENNPHGYVSFYKWERNPSPENILSLAIFGNATGTYSEDFEINYNFDLDSGNKILPKSVFSKSGAEGITKLLNQKVKKDIEDFLKDTKKEFNDVNVQDEVGWMDDQIELYEYCLEGIEESSLAYYTFSFSRDSLIFFKGRCSNHALRAIDELGEL